MFPLDKKFKIDKPQLIANIGKKGSGKTNFTKWVIWLNTIKHKNFKFGIVFSGTENEDYDYIGKDHLVFGWDPEVFERYSTHLENKRKKGKLDKNFLIIDDLVGVLKDDKDFIHFITRHRHFNTTILINVQHMKKGLDPALRENIDMAVLFDTKNENATKGFFEFAGSEFQGYKDFRWWFQHAITKKYWSLIYTMSGTGFNEEWMLGKAPDFSKRKFMIKFEEEKSTKGLMKL